MKKIHLIFIAIAILVIAFVVFWKLINSRSYQTFGRIVPRVETSQRIVALTFDDGPTSTATRPLLEVLAKRQISATFFVTGSELEKDPDLGKRILAAGHELGNHSYSHSRMVFVTPSFVQQEIERTDELIREAGYHNEIYFRPPYGKKFLFLPHYLEQTGRTTVTWDVEPDSGSRRADEIVETALAETRPGSIILLHVMYPNRAESMTAVPKIIDGLEAQGYRFVTVSELLASGG